MDHLKRGFADELLKEAGLRDRLVDLARRARRALGGPKRTQTFQGYPLRIEWEAGELRKGRNKGTGAKWTKPMHHHYGSIGGTKGADGDPVDFYLAREAKEDAPAFVARQRFLSGGFDEDKVLLGFQSKGEAKKGLLLHTNPKRLERIDRFSPEDLAAFVAERSK